MAKLGLRTVLRFTAFSEFRQWLAIKMSGTAFSKETRLIQFGIAFVMRYSELG